TAPVRALRPCRVRCCPNLAEGEHCEDHDTPAVRAMRRPHSYVFEGRRIALDSMAWPEAPAAASPSVDDAAVAVYLETRFPSSREPRLERLLDRPMEHVPVDDWTTDMVRVRILLLRARARRLNSEYCTYF